MSFHLFLLEEYDKQKTEFLKLSVTDILPYIRYHIYETMFTINLEKPNDHCKHCKKEIKQIGVGNGSKECHMLTYLDYIRKLQTETNNNIRRHHTNDIKRIFNIDTSQWTQNKLIYDEFIIEMILQNGIQFNISQFNDIMNLYNITIIGDYTTLNEYILHEQQQNAHEAQQRLHECQQKLLQQQNDSQNDTTENENQIECNDEKILCRHCSGILGIKPDTSIYKYIQIGKKGGKKANKQKCINDNVRFVDKCPHCNNYVSEYVKKKKVNIHCGADLDL